MINFHGGDWAALKQELLKLKESKINLLVSAANHDDSNKIRGAIQVITHLLALEEAAHKAANQRNPR